MLLIADSLLCTKNNDIYIKNIFTVKKGESKNYK